MFKHRRGSDENIGAHIDHMQQILLSGCVCECVHLPGVSER